MKRRDFISASALAGIGMSTSASLSSAEPVTPCCRGTFSMNDNRVSLYTAARITPTKVFHITDTHLSLDDERGEPYREFSRRMAGAYASNPHFQTGEPHSAAENFELTLEAAKKEHADFLVLTGDILSFPSPAAVEWALQKLEAADIPFAYVAGNHDWHYEGMEGSSQKLRETWTAKHLSPLYQGRNPLYAAYEVNGMRFVCIDDSTYEILPEQLDFFKEQAATGIPFVLLMHIPLYLPGRSMGFGCGHPDWGEASDRNYETERREKWRKEGHTPVTMDFCRAVFSAPNLLLVLAGHTHQNSLDINNGIPQMVSRENACGYYASVNIEAL